MKMALTELAALAVALTLFGTGPALTFSSNHDRSHQVRLQIPKQVQKAVKPKSIKSKAVKSKTFKLKAVTTAGSKKKKKQSASTKKHSLAKTVTKPQKTKIPAASTRTRRAIVTIPDETRKTRRRTIPSTAATAKAAEAKAKQQELKDQSKSADGGPQPEPPTTPRRNLLPPKLDSAVKTGNRHLDDLGHLRDAADAMRDLNHLRDLANRDRWGQEQEGWPENGHGMPGDDLNGRVGDDLPSGAKQLETEGAPDFATYFNEPIPRPGGSGGQTAPDDGGPQEGYWRPSHDGASGPRGPGDLKDPRGVASDGEYFNNSHDEDQSGTRVVHDTHGSGYTMTDYDENGHRTAETRVRGDDRATTTTFDENDRPNSRVHYDASGNRIQQDQYTYRNGHTYENTTYFGSTAYLLVVRRDGEVIRRRLIPRTNPNPNDDDASFWEMLDWARAGRTTWMLTPSDTRTLPEKTDEMVSQPGREGAGGGGSAAPSLSQDAVTNNGDSSFNVAPVTPLGYGRAPSRGVAGGECITCD